MERGSAPIERGAAAAMMRYRMDVTHSPAMSGARRWIVTVTVVFLDVGHRLLDARQRSYRARADDALRASGR